MEIRILGPLEVRDGERVVELGGKQAALLADLVIHRGEPLTPDRLADDLWGEHPPPSATKTLRALVSRLRNTLGREAIVMRAGGYVLADDGVTTDVASSSGCSGTPSAPRSSPAGRVRLRYGRRLPRVDATAIARSWSAASQSLHTSRAK